MKTRTDLNYFSLVIVYLLLSPLSGPFSQQLLPQAAHDQRIRWCEEMDKAGEVWERCDGFSLLVMCRFRVKKKEISSVGKNYDEIDLWL